MLFQRILDGEQHVKLQNMSAKKYFMLAIFWNYSLNEELWNHIRDVSMHSKCIIIIKLYLLNFFEWLQHAVLCSIWLLNSLIIYWNN